MHYVTQAQYVSDYKIKITFNDLKQGVIDLRDILQKDKRAIFKELLDQRKFQKFKVDMDTVVWDNGLDLAPEFLYEKVIKK